MRLPNHLLLDFNNNNHSSSSYWLINLVHHNSNRFLFLSNKSFLEKFNLTKTLSLTTPKEYYTVSLNCSNDLLWNNLNRLNLSLPNTTKTTDVINNININFLRKERLYTKLKYSRSPAYDIVSGGAAAIFAGLLGFLVSEKFGFELVDSGDFYYLFMYLVFLVFSIRPLLVVMSRSRSLFYVFTPKHIINYYSTLLILLFNSFK